MPLFLQALPIEHFWTIGRNQISTIQGHCLKEGGKLDKKGEQEHQTFLEKELCAGGTLTCNESLEGNCHVVNKAADITGKQNTIHLTFLRQRHSIT